MSGFRAQRHGSDIQVTPSCKKGLAVGSSWHTRRLSRGQRSPAPSHVRLPWQLARGVQVQFLLFHAQFRLSRLRGSLGIETPGESGGAGKSVIEGDAT